MRAAVDTRDRRLERDAARSARSITCSRSSSADGCWEGEMVWNTMILSQYVIVRRVVGPPARRARARADHPALSTSRQRREGGWGMHAESAGYVFFTTLAYVALRLLGLGADEPSPTT